MAETYNTKAIVLRYVPWREYDRIYTLYTERFGKQMARAQGVKKIHSKLAGALEPFAEIEVFVIQAKSFNKLGGAVVMHHFTQIQQRLDRINAAWLCCELVDQLTKEGETDMALYQLLYTMLTWLDHQASQRTVLYSFVVKLIYLLGYRLQATQNEINKIIFWLQQQPFLEVQKLRLTNSQWSQLLQVLHTWLNEHSFGRIQTEKFLL